MQPTSGPDLSRISLETGGDLIAMFSFGLGGSCFLQSMATKAKMQNKHIIILLYVTAVELKNLSDRQVKWARFVGSFGCSRPLLWPLKLRSQVTILSLAVTRLVCWSRCYKYLKYISRLFLVI